MLDAEDDDELDAIATGEDEIGCAVGDGGAPLLFVTGARTTPPNLYEPAALSNTENVVALPAM